MTAGRETAAPAAPRRRRLRRVLRVAAVLAGGTVIAAGAAAVWLYLEVAGSLPRLDGELALAGLSAPVTVERDGRGVPRIRGASRADVARATGFVHAQDRFFQMDLLRRKAAGELAELVGPSVFSLDREARVHRFRARSRRVLEHLPEEGRVLLRAYAEGVNAGLASLEASPFEYLVLRTAPEPWKPEDSLLVVYSMYLSLQDDVRDYESTLGTMHDLLPDPLYRFLTPAGDHWDAPLLGGPLSPPPIPGPEILDLRAAPPKGDERPSERAPERTEPAEVAGSNNAAVAGRLTKHGGAILAVDMHLPLTVPNIWYRLCLVYPGEDGAERRVAGVSLPGLPVVIAGSNGHVAWGFTNAQMDTADLVILEPVEGDPDSYRTPSGPRKFDRHREVLRARGGETREIEVLETIWGPVVDHDPQGRLRALRWVAHDPRAVNLGLLHMESARTVDEALELATHTGIPVQNLAAADDRGHIGWTLIGPIPRRFGHDGTVPVSWADGRAGWSGYLPPGDYPRAVDPESGRVWTANARVVDAATQRAVLGDGGYALGARARQIRDDLAAIPRAGEEDLMAVQLDDRAVFLARWRDLLLSVLTPEAVTANPERGPLRRYVEDWGGRASVDSVGYRMVRAFRAFTAERVLPPLVAPCVEADPGFRYSRFPRYEGPLWTLVTERPIRLLDPKYADWDALLLDAADAVLDRFRVDGKVHLEKFPWGERNTSRIRHPLSRVARFLSRWLDMPPLSLPGDSHMPRVQAPGFGASERMVVSPGREEDGIFEMPCGQSGHPLSPYYRADHLAWAQGRPTPLLPGPAAHTLTLR